MKYYIAVDPGANGAISILDEKLSVIEIIDMPTRYLKEDEFYKLTGKKKKRKDSRKVINTFAIHNRLKTYQKDSIGFIEHVTSREGDGKASSFTFGSMFQGPKSVMECLGIPYYQITPRKWQGYFKFSTGESKNQSYAKAVEISQEDHFTGPRGGIKDGRSDAYLLGLYGADAITKDDCFWVSRFTPELHGDKLNQS